MVKSGRSLHKRRNCQCAESHQGTSPGHRENLYSDPDFKKSYEESRKAATAKGQLFVPMHEREIIPMIAYLQRMGTDIKVKEVQPNK